jgi:hypothetical protein
LLLKVSILSLVTIFLLVFGTVPIVRLFFSILSLLSFKEIDSNRGNENM